MWRPRDHERFIGSYDPEHEMPDPDRDPRERWQSDVYRHNARDSRFAYRWAPDRIEQRFRDRREELRPGWDRDARDRYIYKRGFLDGREFGRGYDYDHQYAGPRDYPRPYDRGPYYEGDFGRWGEYEREPYFERGGWDRDWDRSYHPRGRNRY